MRKLLLTTAAVAAAIAAVGCGKKVVQQPILETQDTLPIIKYDMLTDTRDGQTYKTVKIGEQTWIAQNLNYKTDSSWCYKNADSNCVKYGRLYTWNAAKEVCPIGWKLPDTADWNRLAKTVGGKRLKECHEECYYVWEGAGKKLKSKCGWYKNGNGTDNYGFSALPSGYRFSDGSFGSAGHYGLWWTATDGSSDYPYGRDVDYNDDYVYEYNDDKSYGYSVRCVANSP